MCVCVRVCVCVCVQLVGRAFFLFGYRLETQTIKGSKLRLTSDVNKFPSYLKTHKMLRRTLFNQTKPDRIRFFDEMLFFKAAYYTKTNKWLLFCQSDSGEGRGQEAPIRSEMYCPESNRPSYTMIKLEMIIIMITGGKSCAQLARVRNVSTIQNAWKHD